MMSNGDLSKVLWSMPELFNVFGNNSQNIFYRDLTPKMRRFNFLWSVWKLLWRKCSKLCLQFSQPGTRKYWNFIESARTFNTWTGDVILNVNGWGIQWCNNSMGREEYQGSESKAGIYLRPKKNISSAMEQSYQTSKSSAIKIFFGVHSSWLVSTTSVHLRICNKSISLRIIIIVLHLYV